MRDELGPPPGRAPAFQLGIAHREVQAARRHVELDLVPVVHQR